MANSEGIPCGNQLVKTTLIVIHNYDSITSSSSVKASYMDLSFRVFVLRERSQSFESWSFTNIHVYKHPCLETIRRPGLIYSGFNLCIYIYCKMWTFQTNYFVNCDVPVFELPIV